MVILLKGVIWKIILHRICSKTINLLMCFRLSRLNFIILIRSYYLMFETTSLQLFFKISLNNVWSVVFKDLFIVLLKLLIKTDDCTAFIFLHHTQRRCKIHQKQIHFISFNNSTAKGMQGYHELDYLSADKQKGTLKKRVVITNAVGEVMVNVKTVPISFL